MTSTSDLHNIGKAVFYAVAVIFAIIVLISNSMTAALQSFWSDTLGNEWQYIWDSLTPYFKSDFWLFIGIPGIIHLAIYWGYSALLFMLDTYVPSFAQAYKVQPETNSPLSFSLFMKAAKQVLFNQMFVSFPVQVACYPIAVWRGVDMRGDLPTFNRMLLDIAVFVLIEEVCFYYVHRLLHHRSLYALIHKQHHEFKAPIGIAAMYAHPIEHAFSNAIPVMIGPLVMGSHLAVLTLWLSVAVLNTINSHSGYHFPLLPSPESHDYHHLKFNECFGVLGLLDYLHGTDKTFRSGEHFKAHTTNFSTEYVSPNPVKKVKGKDL